MKFEYNSDILNTTFHLDNTIQDIDKLLPYNNLYYIIDSNIFKLYHNLFKNKKYFLINADEAHKSIETASRIINYLIDNKADRHCCLIGVGGGITTDLTGFVSSIYKRGIHLALVPTSLLAMVDASIGGKNGLNFNNIKNIAGTFKQPDEVYIFTDFLNTLGENEFRSGFAEIIKISLINNFELFEQIEAQYDDVNSLFSFNLNSIIWKAIQSKVKIVEKDVEDHNCRQLLNLGHSFGHPIESIYKLPHGYAVSLGISIICELSHNFNILTDNSKSRTINILSKFNLPVKYDGDFEELFSFFIHDKKLNNNSLYLILLEDIGSRIQASLNNINIKDLHDLSKDLSFFTNKK